MKLFILILVLVCSPVFALKEYYSISKSIRALGMGGAFYGLSDDEYALFYNPAGLDLYRGSGQGGLGIAGGVSSNAFSAVSDLTKSNDNISDIIDKLGKYQGHPLYGGVTILPYWMKKGFAIGLLVGDLKANVAILGKNFDSEIDVTAIADSGLIVGFSQSYLDDKLHMGLNTKVLFRGGGRQSFSMLDVAQDKSFQINPQSLGGAGLGVDFDLGATYDVPGVPIGNVSRVSAVLNNLVGSTFPWARYGGTPPALPRMLSFGWVTVFNGWECFDNFNFLFDLAELRVLGMAEEDQGARVGSLFKHINFGVEAPLGGIFIPRLGMHQGNISAGFGLNFYVGKLEFATWEEELAKGVGRLSSRRYEMRFVLGWVGKAWPAIGPGGVMDVPKIVPEAAPPSEAAQQAAPAPAPKPAEPERKSNSEETPSTTTESNP